MSIYKVKNDNKQTRHLELSENLDIDYNLKDKISPIFEQLILVCENCINQTKLNRLKTNPNNSAGN